MIKNSQLLKILYIYLENSLYKEYKDFLYSLYVNNCFKKVNGISCVLLKAALAPISRLH